MGARYNHDLLIAASKVTTQENQIRREKEKENQ